jgi:hypothetical protein
MNFSTLLADIEKLKGLQLRSIRPGAELSILEVNRSDERFLIRNADGSKHTRPFSEIRGVWEQLLSSPAIHVDSAIGGSGTRRNQPETILANLPYVEWLNYRGRKHIAFVGHPTHELGTLKRMDAVEAEVWKKRIEGAETNLPTIVVITTDVREAAANLESVTGLKVESVESGVYKKEHNGLRMFIVAQSSLQSVVQPGTYVVLKAISIPPDSSPIRLAGQRLYPVVLGGMNVMVLEPHMTSLLPSQPESA